jgi:hypothetical protein
MGLLVVLVMGLLVVLLVAGLVVGLLVIGLTVTTVVVLGLDVVVVPVPWLVKVPPVAPALLGSTQKFVPGYDSAPRHPGTESVPGCWKQTKPDAQSLSEVQLPWHIFRGAAVIGLPVLLLVVRSAVAALDGELVGEILSMTLLLLLWWWM